MKFMLGSPTRIAVVTRERYRRVKEVETKASKLETPRAVLRTSFA